jgi:large subunit ribosomal protein L23
MPRRLAISAKRLSRSTPPKVFFPKEPQLKPKRPQPKKVTDPWIPKTEPTNSEKVFNWAQDAMKNDQPHFRVGGKEVYFPQAKVILLRPSAKHTPYQAKFIVPRNFNKLDLRDYLYHVYGLRALNVTVQLMWGRWTREQPGRPRYRSPMVKKMTIEMPEPFIWPEPTPEDVKKYEYQIDFFEELKKYTQDSDRQGSDKLKPPRAFGGIVGPYVAPPTPFVSKKLKRELLNKKKAAETQQARQADQELVKNYLGMA